MPQDVEVKILFFAKSRELTGFSAASLSINSQVSGQNIYDTVLKAYPQLAVLQGRFMLSVNQEFVERDQLVELHDGDEIAIIPPISVINMSSTVTENGDMLKITADRLSLQEVSEFVTDPSAGGISIFMGTTRNHFQGKRVVRLEYEAYVSMAMKQLAKLCNEVRQKWKLCRIAIVHRIGVVPVEEPSVIIAASSEHRQDAICAVTYSIDALKSMATIWKKEVYEEGGEVWKENKECTWSS